MEKENHIYSKQSDINSAKTDILDFLYDSQKETYLYKYNDNRNTEVNCMDVFYYNQFKVLFEDHYHHWTVQNALDELADEGEIIIKYTKLYETGKLTKVNFFFRKDLRYYVNKIKEKRSLIEYYSSPDITKAVGDYSELLVKMFFYQTHFEIIDEHTNEYNGKKWEDSKKDLDFIINKNKTVFGVEVKNQFKYMDKEEWKEKMFDMCSYLGVIPILIVRRVPNFYVTKLKENMEGYTINFKRKVFPFGQQSYVRELWNKTMLPVNVDNKIFTNRTIKPFLKWLENFI